MTDEKKPSKFGLGLLIGTMLGAISGLLFAPKSGKETREKMAKKIHQLRKLFAEKEIDKKVKEIFGEVTEEGKKLYLMAKEELIKKLAELKKTIEEIDKEEYIEKVEQVIKKLQKQTKREIREMEKLKNHLAKEWKKLELH